MMLARPRPAQVAANRLPPFSPVKAPDIVNGVLQVLDDDGKFVIAKPLAGLFRK